MTIGTEMELIDIQLNHVGMTLLIYIDFYTQGTRLQQALNLALFARSPTLAMLYAMVQCPLRV